RHYMLDGGAFRTWDFSNARQVVRMVAEDAKPDNQRLPEYTQSKRESLEHDLFAEYPSYPDLEIAKLTTSLQLFREKMAGDPLVQKILEGKDPATRAAELVRGTKMSSGAERKRLYDSGAAGIAASDDPMVRLARDIDEESRAVRLAYESQ